MRLLAVVAAATLAGAGVAVAGRLELRSKAESAGPFVILSEVAVLEGGNSWEAEELRRLPLGLTPSESAKRLTKEYVVCRLRQAGFDGLRVVGAEEVEVRRASGRKGAEMLKEEVVKHVAKLYGLRPDDVVVEIGTQFENGQAEWDPKASIEVLEPKAGSTEIPGEIAVVAEVKAEGGEAIEVSVPVEVSVWREVMVAKRDIPRRRTIMPEDVERRRMLLGCDGGEAVRSESRIVGRRALRAIEKGSVLTADAAEERELIKRGDVVTAQVLGGFFAIRTYARAKENGKSGDVIEVENPKSKQVFLARVIDKNTVEVSE